MPTNVFAICPSPTDATSFYRGLGPLSALKHAHPNDIQISILPAFNWAMLDLINVVFFQRPFATETVDQIKQAKAYGKPVWVDYDDDLLHVPHDNPAFKFYSSPERQKVIAQSIAMADIVTVATQRLYDLWKPIARKIVLIPNAFRDDIFSTEKAEPQQKKHVLWRGSNTHDRDLRYVAAEIIALGKKHFDWTFTFLGWHPWYITNEMAPNQAVVIDTLDPADYFAFLRRTAPRIVMVPLYPCDFNVAKSNIGWIEATYAGAVAVGPDMPEWKRPGCINYKTPADFFATMDRLMTDDVNLADLHDQSWRTILETLRLSEVNKLRFEVITELAALAKDTAWKTEAREGRGDRAISAKA